MNCIAGLFVVILGAVPYTTWQQVYDKGNADMGHGVCLDSADGVVVIGETHTGTDYDAWIIVISESGDSLYSIAYNDGGDEQGFAGTVTDEGGIGIATLIDEVSMRTILYDIEGELLWERETRGDGVAGIISTSDKKIYTSCWYYQLERDYLVVKGYDYQGETLVGVNEMVLDGDLTGIVLDVSGSIYLGADRDGLCKLWKFNSEGTFEWWANYGDLTTKGFGLEMNDALHLFQSGDVATNGSNSDFLLLKWDTTGALIWPEHKAYDLGHNEYCRDIKLDAISDCYLAGWQVRGLEKDAALVKTDSAGNMLWNWVYEMEGDQEIEAIEVDSDGYIYLAGSHHNGENWDMLVMQVRQPLMITGRVTDSVGGQMENIRVVLTGDTLVEVVTDTGGYYSIEVYNGGDYTVSPDLPGWAFLPSSYTYSPLAHREFDQNFSGEWTGIGEAMIPIAFDLQVEDSRINYSVHYAINVKIGVYDVAGRLVKSIVNEKVKPGKYCEEWQGKDNVGRTLASGVYFVKMMTEDFEKTDKIVILE